MNQFTIMNLNSQRIMREGSIWRTDSLELIGLPNAITVYKEPIHNNEFVFPALHERANSLWGIDSLDSLEPDCSVWNRTFQDEPIH